MSLSGSLGKSGSDFFAELFTTGTVSSDVSQNSPSDTPSVPTGSSNPGPNETTAQSAPPHPAALLADNGADGSLPDLDSESAGTVADASSGHASASATFYQDPTTDSDNAFYALSSTVLRVDQTLAERKCRMALESIRNGYRPRGCRKPALMTPKKSG